MSTSTAAFVARKRWDDFWIEVGKGFSASDARVPADAPAALLTDIEKRFADNLKFSACLT
jgi:hypothetical protein